MDPHSTKQIEPERAAQVLLQYIEQHSGHHPTPLAQLAASASQLPIDFRYTQPQAQQDTVLHLLSPTSQPPTTGAAAAAAQLGAQYHHIPPHHAQATASLITVQRDRTHSCDFPGCNKAFISASHVKTHRRTHTGEKPFACDMPACPRAFADAGALKRHKRTHSGEKPYKCDEPNCGRTFAEAGTLATHRRTHTGEKPYICDVEGCGKTFSVVGNLKRHKRSHTGEKQFRCDFPGCAKAFTRSSTLSQHMSTHSKGMSSTSTVQVCTSFHAGPDVYGPGLLDGYDKGAGKLAHDTHDFEQGSRGIGIQHLHSAFGTEAPLE